jgi:ketosteroid isomerase-like protein
MPASLELVRIALQAYGNGDVEIALALSDPMIRWDERASRPDGDLVWGHDDVAKAMRRYLDGWEQYSFELEDIAEVAPGKVVGICRERGVDTEGVPIDRRFGGLWVVQKAKIASWSTYLTPKEAVRAARELVASEPPPPKPKAGPRPKPASGPRAVPEAGQSSEPQTEKGPTEEQRRAAKARARLQRQKAAS